MMFDMRLSQDVPLRRRRSITPQVDFFNIANA